MFYNYLLDKLRINDFILRGEYGAAVMDLILDYAKLVNSSKFKLETELQGLPLEVIQSLLELDQPTLDALVNGVVENNQIPFEKPQEYLDLEDKVAKLKAEINNTTDEASQKQLTVALQEAEQALTDYRKAYWQKELLTNPDFLMKNSKFLLQLIKSLNKPIELNDEQRQKMLKIRREIELNFLLLKGYSFEEADKIAKGIHPLSLTNKEFLDLLTAIIENDELLNAKKPFFTFIQN